MWDYYHTCISSFLHYRHNKALHHVVNAMDSKVNIQHNTLMQLENSMLMHGVYNVEILKNLLLLFTTYTISLPHMKDYLQDSIVLLYLECFMHML